MFRLITINFSQKSPHFSLLSPTSPRELSEREVTSPSNLKVVGALSSDHSHQVLINLMYCYQCHAVFINNIMLQVYLGS